MVQTVDYSNEYSNLVDGQQVDDDGQRYQQPSMQEELSNPYTLQTFRDNDEELIFNDPEEVIYAYYGILKEASNLSGNSDRDGTKDETDLPYLYAYQLLAAGVRQDMSLQQFQNSFRGIGDITFLQIQPLPGLPESPLDTKYFMIEIEVIETGCFAYYYGIVTVEKGKNGWKIQEIDYYPEEFLYTPYREWSFDSEELVNYVFKDQLKVIDQIMNKIEKDGVIHIYAPGNKYQFRFDFVRLTNGYDILINENIMINGKWHPTELLTETWKNLKLQDDVFMRNPAASYN